MLNRLKRWPIALRMSVSALILVIVILPLAAALLAWNFRQTMESSFNNQLASLLDAVVSSVHYSLQEDSLALRRELADPRFTRVFSGWYWQATDGGERILTSRSLWDQRLEAPAVRDLNFHRLEGPRDQTLVVASRQILLAALSQPVTVSVAADADSLDEDIQRFQALLFGSLAVLGILLSVLVWLQVVWGLAPLRRIERSLKAVESGDRTTLDTNLPEELASLARAINLVLERDQALIERGRTTAGNLAHSLKTPISVLKTLAERLPAEQGDAVDAELARLDGAIRHHLARASAAGPVSLGKALPLQQTLAPVIDAIAQLCRRRGLAFHHQFPPGAIVRADAQDVQEMVGNLLENAVKWARSELQVHSQISNNVLILTVEDDGPGMSVDQCAMAFQRGVRLDEAQSDSGLGLAIVQDLVRLYGGDIQLGRSQLGGLRAFIHLPL